MRTPSGMSSPVYTPTTLPSGNGVDKQPSFVVKHGKMKQGLLARAAIYTNNASKGISSGSQFNGSILKAERDPIVWGDASNRYNPKSTEINNNRYPVLHQATESYDSTVQFNSVKELAKQEPKKTLLSLPPMTSSPVPIKIEDLEKEKNNFGGILTIAESPITIDYETKTETNQKSPPFLHMSTEAKRLSFDTTQQLRSGFFRSIKRQYSPLMPSKNEVQMPGQNPKNNSSDSASSSSNTNTDNSNDSDADSDESRDTVSNTMSQLAKQKLEQLRLQGPKKVDVATGLQWIRLELHEMREQDKSLFLQLIKLHSTIKDLRSDFNGADDYDSYDDLHSAAPFWWPRRGYSYSATTLPDFSSSDGAQMIRNGRPKPPLRRGFSLNYPPTVGPSSRLNFDFSRSPLISNSTSTDSELSLNLSDWRNASPC